MGGINRDREIAGRENINLVENLPPTIPHTCPFHKDVTYFVLVPHTSVYICPIGDHGEGAGGPVDQISFKTRGGI